MGALTFTFAVIFLPETSHDRGIDKMRADGKKGWRGTEWVWLNPLRPLELLKLRNNLAIVSCNSFIADTIANCSQNVESKLIVHLTNNLLQVRPRLYDQVTC